MLEEWMLKWLAIRWQLLKSMDFSGEQEMGSAHVNGRSDVISHTDVDLQWWDLRTCSCLQVYSAEFSIMLTVHLQCFSSLFETNFSPRASALGNIPNSQVKAKHILMQAMVLCRCRSVDWLSKYWLVAEDQGLGNLSGRRFIVYL